MRLFTAIVLIGLLPGSAAAGAQALRKNSELSPPAEVEPLATEDMNRTIKLTDGFTDEAARMSAVVAVERSVLRKGS